MKTKITTFFILFPMLEIISYLLVIASQVLYLVQNSALDGAGFGQKYIYYVVHPGVLIQDCFNVHNPFIIFMPIIALLISIYVVTKTYDRRSGIETTNTIYGSAQWENIHNLTRKNKRGLSAFKTIDKDTLMQNFMESINNDK